MNLEQVGSNQMELRLNDYVILVSYKYKWVAQKRADELNKCGGK